MKWKTYCERDSTSGQAMLKLRTNISLRQSVKPTCWEFSRCAVGEWEGAVANAVRRRGRRD